MDVFRSNLLETYQFEDTAFTAGWTEREHAGSMNDRTSYSFSTVDMCSKGYVNYLLKNEMVRFFICRSSHVCPYRRRALLVTLNIHLLTSLSDAKNWLSISECDVAACQRGPCRNNATCIQNKENSQQYTCQCGTGYYGKDCTEREAHCQGDPCNGGTCAWTPTGHICLCQYGRHGAACLSGKQIFS